MVFETCIICQCDLLAQRSDATSPDVSALECGHVFHRNCVERWLERSNHCPNCKRQVERKVDKLYFDEDEFASELETGSEETKTDEAWYKQYDKELIFGAGAIAGGVIAGVLGALFSGKKQKK